MKSCKKFGLAAIALVLGALLCMSITGCPNPNSAESKPYVGTYKSESGDLTIVLKSDGTSTWSMSSNSGSGTYTVSGSSATATYTTGTPSGTVTAETTDNWATFTANSAELFMNNTKFTKQ
jgi:hypothetical protein